MQLNEFINWYNCLPDKHFSNAELIIFFNFFTDSGQIERTSKELQDLMIWYNVSSGF